MSISALEYSVLAGLAVSLSLFNIVRALGDHRVAPRRSMIRMTTYHTLAHDVLLLTAQGLHIVLSQGVYTWINVTICAILLCMSMSMVIFRLRVMTWTQVARARGMHG